MVPANSPVGTNLRRTGRSHGLVHRGRLHVTRCRRPGAQATIARPRTSAVANARRACSVLRNPEASTAAKPSPRTAHERTATARMWGRSRKRTDRRAGVDVPTTSRTATLCGTIVASDAGGTSTGHRGGMITHSIDRYSARHGGPVTRDSGTAVCRRGGTLVHRAGDVAG